MQTVETLFRKKTAFFLPPSPLSSESSPHRNERSGGDSTRGFGDSGQRVEATAPDDAADPTAGWELSQQQLSQQIARLQRQTRLAIEASLRPFAGHSRGDTQSNQAWVRQIADLLDAHGLRVRCPECGHASILRVSPRRGSAAGVFVYDHTIEGRRTFHGGGGRLPTIRLMSKPRRKPAAKKSA